MQQDNISLTQKVDELTQKVDELMSVVNSLKSSATIPLQIDQAFRARLVPLSYIGTGSAGTQGISLSGAPETITVPEQPSGTIAVTTLSGQTYNLYFK